MVKKQHKGLNREYFVDESRTEPVNGIPCFSKAEVNFLKTNLPGEVELKYLFDRRTKEGTAVETVLAEYFLGEIEREKEIFHRPPETEIIYNNVKENERSRIAKEWAKKIRETIAASSVRLEK